MINRHYICFRHCNGNVLGCTRILSVREDHCVKSMKWVVELSPEAITWRSGKTVTLRLSGSCHPTERSWMEVGRIKRRLFITSGLPKQKKLFHSNKNVNLYDHSLPHARLATDDMQGE
ncbi:unnamed protein product [Spirodela intermedia]|uniref:Uncharacterized protein n=1 Tax=Spirodela intermedia TaxID=51605 RepID=A0ABN7E9N8_SPIIN|nr:unnamed protein product [Spirodela intermedia]